MKPIRIGVVGCGHLGRIHTRILSGMAGFELVGVADPVEAARQRTAVEYHTRPFATHQELAAEVDALVVAAPTTYHHAIALELLDRGRHLLVEKPLAPTAAEADALVRAAQTRRVVLQVGHVERFNPAWTQVARELRDPKYIEGRRFGGFTFRSTDIGVVLDLMIHDLDLVLSIVGSEPVRVEALGVALFGRPEDVATARITFANGAIAQLSASRAARAPQRTMQLWSRGGLASVDFQTRTCQFVRPSAAIIEGALDVEALSPGERDRLRGELLNEHLPLSESQAPAVDAITAELQDFGESIRTGRSPRVSGEHGRNAVALAERVLEAIEEHAWDGVASGPVGPHGRVRRAPIPAPHWPLRTGAARPLEREAG